MKKEAIKRYVQNNFIKLLIIGGLFLAAGIIPLIIFAFTNVGDDGYIIPNYNTKYMFLTLIPIIIGFLIIMISIIIIDGIAKQKLNIDLKKESKPSPLEQDFSQEKALNTLQAKSGIDNKFIHKTLTAHKKRLAKRFLSLKDEKEFWNRANLILPQNEPPRMFNISKIKSYIKYFYEQGATTLETAIPLNEFLKEAMFANAQTTMYIANEVINYRQDCSVYLNVPKIKSYFKMFAGSFAVIWITVVVVLLILPHFYWIVFIATTVGFFPMILYYVQLPLYLKYYRKKYPKHTYNLPI